MVPIFRVACPTGTGDAEGGRSGVIEIGFCRGKGLASTLEEKRGGKTKDLRCSVLYVPAYRGDNVGVRGRGLQDCLLWKVEAVHILPRYEEDDAVSEMSCFSNCCMKRGGELCAINKEHREEMF